MSFFSAQNSEHRRYSSASSLGSLTGALFKHFTRRLMSVCLLKNTVCKAMFSAPSLGSSTRALFKSYSESLCLFLRSKKQHQTTLCLCRFSLALSTRVLLQKAGTPIDVCPSAQNWQIYLASLLKKESCATSCFSVSPLGSQNLGFVQKSHKAGECLSVSLLKTGKYVCSLCSNTPQSALCFSASGSLNSGFAQSSRRICNGCLAAQNWHICEVSLLKMQLRQFHVFLALFSGSFNPGFVQNKSWHFTWPCLCSKQSIMCGFSA